MNPHHGYDFQLFIYLFIYFWKSLKNQGFSQNVRVTTFSNGLVKWLCYIPPSTMTRNQKYFEIQKFWSFPKRLTKISQKSSSLQVNYSFWWELDLWDGSCVFLSLPHFGTPPKVVGQIASLSMKENHFCLATFIQSCPFGQVCWECLYTHNCWIIRYAIYLVDHP